MRISNLIFNGELELDLLVFFKNLNLGMFTGSFVSHALLNWSTRQNCCLL